jgi:hypothetical protein
MDLNSGLNIVPGLFGLNLNILHAIDMHMIDNAKHRILKWIQKEHRIVANVQKTMVASSLVLFRMLSIVHRQRSASVILYKLRYIVSKSANAFRCLGDSLTICSSSILASPLSLGILVFSKATMVF